MKTRHLIGPNAVAEIPDATSNVLWNATVFESVSSGKHELVVEVHVADKALAHQSTKFTFENKEAAQKAFDHLCNEIKQDSRYIDLRPNKA